MTTGVWEAVVCVAVAQVWTSPASPRDIDAPLLGNPVDIAGWLASLTVEDRLALHDDDLVQTQLLYGTPVIVLEEQGGWAKIAIPSQPSSKDQRGYPGWVPKRQLMQATSVPIRTGVTAVVKVPTATLVDEQRNKRLELSFLTQLPLLEETGDWVKVATPHGPQFLRRDQIKLVRDDERPTVCGAQLVEKGKQFLGLPYLWSGTSAYGYDCSGFMYSLHRYYGITIPRDASNQALAGQRVEPAQLLPGDLLFFAYEQGKGRVHHVAMYAGDGHILHSPKTGKSIEVIPLAGFEYEHEFCIARRYWG